MGTEYTKHRKLWDTMLYGAQEESINAAKSLHKLGELSDRLFQIFLFASLSASNVKGGKIK